VGFSLLDLKVDIFIEQPRGFDVPTNVLNFGRLLSCSGWLPKVRFEDGIAEMWNHISQEFRVSK